MAKWDAFFREKKWKNMKKSDWIVLALGGVLLLILAMPVSERKNTDASKATDTVTQVAETQGETAEESAQRIDAFEVLFQEAIAQAVTSRMRGSGAPKAPQAPRGYSWEELRNMTHQEINANWTAVQKALESGG